MVKEEKLNLGKSTLYLSKLSEDSNRYPIYFVIDEISQQGMYGRPDHPFKKFVLESKYDPKLLNLFLAHKNHFLLKDRVGSIKDKEPLIPIIYGNSKKLLEKMKENKGYLKNLSERTNLEIIKQSKSLVAVFIYCLIKSFKKNKRRVNINDLDKMSLDELEERIDSNMFTDLPKKIRKEIEKHIKEKSLLKTFEGKNFYDLEKYLYPSLLFIEELIHHYENMIKSVRYSEEEFKKYISRYTQLKLLKPYLSISCCTKPNCNYFSLSLGEVPYSPKCPFCEAEESIFSVVIYKPSKFIDIIKFREDVQPNSSEIGVLIYTYLLNYPEKVVSYPFRNIRCSRDQSPSEIDLVVKSTQDLTKCLLIEGKIFQEDSPKRFDSLYNMLSGEVKSIQKKLKEYKLKEGWIVTNLFDKEKVENVLRKINKKRKDKEKIKVITKEKIFLELDLFLNLNIID